MLKLKNISSKNRRVIKSYEKFANIKWKAHLVSKPKWTKDTLAIFKEDTFWIKITGKCKRKKLNWITVKYMKQFNEFLNTTYSLAFKKKKFKLQTLGDIVIKIEVWELWEYSNFKTKSKWVCVGILQPHYFLNNYKDMLVKK